MPTCPHCGAIAHDLKSHNGKYHRQKLVCGSSTLLRDQAGNFECAVCSFKTNNYVQMQNHLRRREHLDRIKTVENRSAGPSQPYPIRRVAEEPSSSPSGRSVRGLQTQVGNFLTRLQRSTEQVSGH
jgi:hypothetical protein